MQDLLSNACHSADKLTGWTRYLGLGPPSNSDDNHHSPDKLAGWTRYLGLGPSNSDDKDNLAGRARNSDDNQHSPDKLAGWTHYLGFSHEGRLSDVAGDFLDLQNEPDAIVYTYPDFAPSLGHVTDKYRVECIKAGIERKILPEQAATMPHIRSLVASNDPSHPIYFWQLYSVLGETRIQGLITKFYQRIFDDAEQPWFRDFFIEAGSLKMHILSQKMMWLDVMGGGRKYKGGESRMQRHHVKVAEIMTQSGAKRWMEHMVLTLDDPSADFNSDPRVRPALDVFLRYFMGKYAHDFDFDDSILNFGNAGGCPASRVNTNESHGLNPKPEDSVALGAGEHVKARL